MRKKIDTNIKKLLVDMPKRTAQEKIICKTLSVLGEAEYRLKVKDKVAYSCCMAYAKGLLESLLIKDDEVKNESKSMVE